MFAVLAEIVVGVVIAALECIGAIVLDGVFEAIAKIPVAIWSAFQTMWQEFWR